MDRTHRHGSQPHPGGPARRGPHHIRAARPPPRGDTRQGAARPPRRRGVLYSRHWLMWALLIWLFAGPAHPAARDEATPMAPPAACWQASRWCCWWRSSPLGREADVPTPPGQVPTMDPRSSAGTSRADSTFQQSLHRTARSVTAGGVTKLSHLARAPCHRSRCSAHTRRSSRARTQRRTGAPRAGCRESEHRSALEDSRPAQCIRVPTI